MTGCNCQPVFSAPRFAESEAKLVNYFDSRHFQHFLASGRITTHDKIGDVTKNPFPAFVRVARWFVFKPKIPIWVNFGGPLNGKCWYIL
jgi:hypothetical protein